MQLRTESQDTESFDSISEQLFIAVQNNQIRRLKQIFKQFPSLNLTEITSINQPETLLHSACQNSSMQIIEMIVEYFEKSPQANLLQHFIDMRNYEGYTSIHLASFSGKLQAVEYLHSKGANLTLTNVAGLTSMHTAAQGDSISVMCYLKIQGLSIDQRDTNGRTPLHWSAYQSATNSISFLLAWGAKFDEIDNDNQMTPLHYAVISGSISIVRKLLLAGADKYLQDFEGLTPYDHAVEKKQEIIGQILSSKPGLAEACNLQIPFEKLRKRKRLVILFICLYLSSFIGSLFFVIPYVASVEIFSIFITLSALTLLLFVGSWICNPGYISEKNKTDEHMLNLLNHTQDPSHICAKCQIIQPKRSKHCDICNKCVKVYDHHCPWINNCVGSNNFKFFYSFILSLFVQIVFQLVLHGLYFSSTVPVEYYFIDVFESQETIEVLHLVTSIYCTIICSFFLICVGKILQLFSKYISILLGVQTSNLFQGVTTSEKYGYKSKRRRRREKQYQLKKNLKQFQIKKVDNFGDDVNNSNFSESMSTTIDHEQSLLGSFGEPSKKSGVITNIFDMCIRNNSNPNYDLTN